MNEKIFMKKKILIYRIMAVLLLIPILIGISMGFTHVINYLQTGKISDDLGGSLKGLLTFNLVLLGSIYVPYNLWGYQSLIIDDDGFSPPVRRTFWYTMKNKNPFIRWEDITKVEIYKENATKSGEMLYHTYWIFLKDKKLVEGINNTFRVSKNRKKFYFTINRKRKDVSNALEKVLKKNIPDKVEETRE